MTDEAPSWRALASFAGSLAVASTVGGLGLWLMVSATSVSVEYLGVPFGFLSLVLATLVACYAIEAVSSRLPWGGDQP